MWSKLWAFLIKNWKTTVGGILIGIVAILAGADIISKEVAATIIAILTGLGFVVAKDGDKTGV